MAAWTVGTTIAYSRPERRSRLLLSADLAVTVGLMMSTAVLQYPYASVHGALPVTATDSDALTAQANLTITKTDGVSSVVAGTADTMASCAARASSAGASSEDRTGSERAARASRPVDDSSTTHGSSATSSGTARSTSRSCRAASNNSIDIFPARPRRSCFGMPGSRGFPRWNASTVCCRSAMHFFINRIGANVNG